MIGRLLTVFIVGAMLFTAPLRADDCQNCGTVNSVDRVKAKSNTSGAGMILGGLVGGVVGNQFGKGSGRTLATVAGAAGGAYAGNEIEKNNKEGGYWAVSVSMDYGERRSFKLNYAPDFAAGDRVRIVDGAPVRVNSGGH